MKLLWLCIYFSSLGFWFSHLERFKDQSASKPLEYYWLILLENQNQVSYADSQVLWGMHNGIIPMCRPDFILSFGVVVIQR